MNKKEINISGLKILSEVMQCINQNWALAAKNSD